ncbi:MAG: aldo/keto reductase [Candidatus Margulisiibacteriota bacterium]
MTLPELNWHGMTLPQLVLGTVQLGLPYGVANVSGQPSFDEAQTMITCALESGLTWFDTAQSYGDSEAVLGASFLSSKIQPTVITKLHPDLDPTDSKAVFESIRLSCQILNQPTIFAVLLHRAEALAFWDKGLGEGLLRAKDAGLVQLLGVSVYEPDELKAVTEHPHMAVAQLPFNAWDNRFLTTHALTEAQNNGVLCFARSIFLQGLLLMPPAAIESRVPGSLPIATAWEGLCVSLNLNPEQVAIRYAKAFGLPLVLGVERLGQLQNNLSLILEPAFDIQTVQHIAKTLHPFSKKEIVNPSLWPVS